ncbi:glycosyltransferase, group 1 family protein [Dictyocaulus viviparus]|uniref:Glycosyltransferase, group 1 family protein n=1 Tax=Dictyocaulus viviparus TaxID=29172 RepID=A0A0D8XID1_DICVI|nr:glycosyltransferase, group 1 family protein [Dictyocaulus viviparus]
MNLLPPKAPREQKPKRFYRRQSLVSESAQRTLRSAKIHHFIASKESADEETEDHIHTEEDAPVDDHADCGISSEMKMEKESINGASVKTEDILEESDKKGIGEDLEDDNVSKPSTSRKRQVDDDYDIETKGSAEIDDDEDEDYEEKPRKKSNKDKKRTEKSEKKPRELKDKKTPKRRSSLSFEDAIGGTPKGTKKKHDPKKDKPMFVGGLPMAAIQDGPVVPNAYNYDPMAEIMKLGTGQLQSAYRKSKLNICPPKDKKIYKLEPKHHEEECSTNCDDKDTKQVPSRRYSNANTSVPPRTGFMPRLHDISPSTASTSLKSPVPSPAVKRMHTSSLDSLNRTMINAADLLERNVIMRSYILRSPVDVTSTGSRSSRTSIGECGAETATAEISPLMRNGTITGQKQQHSSPVAPSFMCHFKCRDEVLLSGSRNVTKPQEHRKARFADNPVSDISPPPASTTPPLMPSPGPQLRSPDLPPTFTSSLSTTHPISSVNTRIPMKQALLQLGQIVKELNEDKFVYIKPAGVSIYFRRITAVARSDNKKCLEEARKGEQDLYNSEIEFYLCIGYIRYTAVVVVLGDIGRSPRMCYHAYSLATELNYDVKLVARLKSAKFVIDWHNYMWSVMKDKYQIGLPDVEHLTLPRLENGFENKESAKETVVKRKITREDRDAAIIASKSKRHSNVVDKRERKNFKRRYIEWVYRWEGAFGRRADAGLCVTRAMREDMQKAWGVHAAVFYDRPLSITFREFSLIEKHELLLRLRWDENGQIFSAHPAEHGFIATRFTIRDPTTQQVQLRDDRPLLAISSTSWTPDEDFQILLDALKKYNDVAKINRSSSPATRLPVIVFLITGRGPLKDYYMEKIRRMKMEFVEVRTLWLEPKDYPLMIATADLGVSLHTSTSGLDLPMKVVDMFGVGIPVLVKRFNCISELVQNGKNGNLFDTANDLFQHLYALATGFPKHCAKLLAMKQFVLDDRLPSWEENWSTVAKPILAPTLDPHFERVIARSENSESFWVVR